MSQQTSVEASVVEPLERLDRFLVVRGLSSGCIAGLLKT
jgi:hypothetical protein